MEFNFDRKENSIIKVIGVGGGGGNAVAYMYDQGIVGVDFAICNTDNQALESSNIPIKLQLGPELTEGMGAGSKPEIGKQACIESIDDVRKFLEKGTKMLFIAAGLGGGTGTGAAPVIAKAAKEMGILTVGIVTLPFKFEGRRRTRQALEGLEAFKNSVDAVLIIANERLKDLYGNLKMEEAFSKADDILTTAAKGIAEIITVTGKVNVDFKDVETVMQNSGVALMGIGLASGQTRAAEAINKAINSPLLENNDIRGAKHILINISYGNEDLSMDEMSEIMDYVEDEAGHGTDLFFGRCQDESLGDQVRITLIATGFGGKVEEKAAKVPEKIYVPLNEPFSNNNEESVSIIDNKNDYDKVVELDTSSANTLNFDISDNFSDKTKEPFVKKADISESFNTKEKRGKNPAKADLNRISNPLEGVSNISEIESQPAYLRKKVSLDDVGDSALSKLSRYAVQDADDDQPVIERHNSFIHDSVD